MMGAEKRTNVRKTGRARKRLFALLLSIGLLLPQGMPVAAKTVNDNGSDALVEKDELVPGTYVEGEAIVCYKAGGEPASKPEDQVKQEVDRDNNVKRPEVNILRQGSRSPRKAQIGPYDDIPRKDVGEGYDCRVQHHMRKIEF